MGPAISSANRQPDPKTNGKASLDHLAVSDEDSALSPSMKVLKLRVEPSLDLAPAGARSRRRHHPLDARADTGPVSVVKRTTSLWK